MIVPSSLACVYGAPRKGLGEGTPQLGEGKASWPVFHVSLPLYFLAALLAKQAGFPMPRACPSPVQTQAGKPQSPWALKTRQPPLNLA